MGILNRNKYNKIAVFDFFCGCGGTSRGFQKAGMNIAFALDIDHDAKNTFTKNFTETTFCDKSITKLTDPDIAPTLKEHAKSYKLFCGCAPCQPFTKQNTQSPKREMRKSLLSRFGIVIEKYKPDFVFVENVPGMQKVPKYRRGPFPEFKELLEKMNYHISYGVVAAQDYGTPQLRRRFVLLASKHGEISIPLPTHGKGCDNAYTSVRDAIADLPPIAAGEEYNSISIFNHRAAELSVLNKKRIMASKHDGGGRSDWPRRLWPECYTRKDEEGKTHSGHTDCYGRLWWDKPATGLTTRCISYSNGRFGHPEQNRAISIREAARLQGFDDDFIFTGNLNGKSFYETY
jgi:DNA (cytosine-5)-methyltransferase 1